MQSLTHKQTHIYRHWHKALGMFNEYSITSCWYTRTPWFKPFCILLPLFIHLCIMCLACYHLQANIEIPPRNAKQCLILRLTCNHFELTIKFQPCNHIQHIHRSNGLWHPIIQYIYSQFTMTENWLEFNSMRTSLFVVHN